jgi:hypothetical protein
MALVAQENMQAPISKATSVGREVTKPSPQHCVIGPLRSLVHHLAVRIHEYARRSLAHLIGLGDISDGFPLGDGRHFFVSGSLCDIVEPWRQPKAASAWCSHPQATSNASPPSTGK